MIEERIQTYKNILEVIKREQQLNEELIAYGNNELGNLEFQRLTALENRDFYITAAIEAAEYSEAKRDVLLNIISKSAQNGVELPQSENEAINIAAEQSMLACKLNYEMERLVEDMVEITMHQIELEEFANATEDTIKILIKK